MPETPIDEMTYCTVRNNLFRAMKTLRWYEKHSQSVREQNDPGGLARKVMRLIEKDLLEITIRNL